MLDFARKGRVDTRLEDSILGCICVGTGFHYQVSIVARH